MISWKTKIAQGGVMLLLICSSAAALHLLTTLATRDSARRHLAAWLKGAQYEGTAGVALQTRTMNCGPAALQMALDSWGVERTLAEIENAVTLDEQGSSLLDLMRYAQNQGLHTEAWQLNIKDLENKQLPAIVFIDGDHFAVLDRITPQDEVVLRDPAIGQLKMSKAAFERIWQGETLLLKK
ncbi:MAG: ABC-type bacteriocin/lantibiotic exporter with double-glycine peptidase domain [Candidatus Latescibacterota bacterium]|jgi:ABC-type bacteriocin/lantibiotic exporter with double-glycine peptidase domain